MKVSIITPSFNQVEYLESAIRSVLAQGYEDIEYFIVDGGSTDGSVDIIRQYQDQLAWWVSEPDKGQANAINKGLQRATGEVIAWVNSDDVLAPGTVTAAVQVFQGHPEVCLVYGDAISIDQDGAPFHYQAFEQYGVEELVAFHIICQPAVFFRKSSLEETGLLDENYHFLLDHRLWLGIAQVGELYHVPEVWAFPRYHSGAKNILKSADFAREAFHLLEWMKSQPRLSQLIAENENEVMAMYHRFSARYLLDAGEGYQALQRYVQSFRHNPGIAMEEWNRVLFSILSTLGLGFLGKTYYQLQRQRFDKSKSNPGFVKVDELFKHIHIDCECKVKV